MPVGKILPYHAIKTLTQLHAELGGKIEGNRKQGDKLRLQMMQVEAVMKMLDPEVNLRIIAPKRRAAVDALRRAEKPMTARDAPAGAVRQLCIAPKPALHP